MSMRRKSPSGKSKAAEIADATGRIIDRCRDYGDNMQFRERWAFAWKDFGKEAAKTDDMK